MVGEPTNTLVQLKISYDIFTLREKRCEGVVFTSTNNVQTYTHNPIPHQLSSVINSLPISESHPIGTPI